MIISCSVRMVRNISSFIYAHLHINSIGHFRVPSDVPLFQSESECETILMKMTLICMKMKLHAELIFIWQVSHLHSFWNRGTRELRNGLLYTVLEIIYWQNSPSYWRFNSSNQLSLYTKRTVHEMELLTNCLQSLFHWRWEVRNVMIDDLQKLHTLWARLLLWHLAWLGLWGIPVPVYCTLFTENIT